MGKMRIGRRKIAAGLAILAAAALATLLWNVWGTDGLVAMTLLVVVVGNLTLGWLVIETRRQTSALIGEIFTTLVASQNNTHDAEQADKLLRAIDARLARTELTLEHYQLRSDDTLHPMSDRPASTDASDDQRPTTR